jgi:predicted nucleic acid-binding protein
LTLLHAAATSGVVTIHRITENLWNQAEEIFVRYEDVRLSFTDCTSFALLQTEHADEVFGYDSHFEMMGHVLQPKG